MHRVSVLKNTFPLLVIVAYSFLSIFSVFYISHTAHIDSGSHSCPYMIGTHGVCSMDLFDHESVWQQFSKAYFPMLEILMIVGGGVIGYFVLRYHASPPRGRLFWYRTLPEPLYQFLFSNGILHSRAY